MKAINFSCPECGCSLHQKPNTPFFRYHNCRYDTEPLYDAAVLRGFELGLDVVFDK